MKELLDKNAVATDLERTVLTSPDDITVCKRNESDSAAITVLKDAIDAKKIDIHTYQHNFGSNYTNDLRILDSDDITLKKMITFCRNLDMSMSITIEDSDKDIANPMNQIFTTKII